MVIVAYTALGAAPPVAAAPALPSDSGWVPVPAPPFDIPAGVACSFAVHGEPLKNEVVSRVLEAYPDGSPRKVFYRGDLVYRVSNPSNGHAVVRDAGAIGIQDIAEDNSSVWTFIGPIVWGFPANDPISPGLYEMTGLHVVKVTADGTSRMLVDGGPKENLCETLR
jgi:hypothetical protein